MRNRTFRARRARRRRVMAEKWNLVVSQCPVHPTFVTLHTDNENGGTRLLGGKCCPSQYSRTIGRWRLNAAECRSIIEELEHIAADMEKR